jgi:hypothetical protein
MQTHRLKRVSDPKIIARHFRRLRKRYKSAAQAATILGYNYYTTGWWKRDGIPPTIFAEILLLEKGIIRKPNISQLAWPEYFKFKRHKLHPSSRHAGELHLRLKPVLPHSKDRHILELCLLLGLKPNQFAPLIGYTPKTFYAALSNGAFSLKLGLRLCHTLNINPYWLAGAEVPMQPNQPLQVVPKDMAGSIYQILTPGKTRRAYKTRHPAFQRQMSKLLTRHGQYGLRKRLQLCTGRFNKLIDCQRPHAGTRQLIADALKGKFPEPKEPKEPKVARSLIGCHSASGVAARKGPHSTMNVARKGSASACCGSAITALRSASRMRSSWAGVWMAFGSIMLWRLRLSMSPLLAPGGRL